jgi:prophage antirepressor-like protein
MNTAIQLFKFENKQEIRVVKGDDGEPWFMASGVCRALQYTNTSKALSDHVDKEDIQYLVLGPGQVIGGITQSYTPGSSAIINEPGLYSLSFSSTLPEARRFRKWITSEVLPAIRKTGTYSVKPMSQVEMLLAQAQIMLDHENRLAAIEEKQREADTAFLALPEPTVQTPEKSLRAALNECARLYAVSRNVSHNTVWNLLYKELKYRKHFDVKSRKLSTGQNYLDLIEDAGLLPELYAIARELLV